MLLLAYTFYSCIACGCLFSNTILVVGHDRPGTPVVHL